jgi:hypothetical protein
VDFQAGLTGTIVLTTGQLYITKDLTIAGPGGNVITVSGNGTSEVLSIGAFTVDISGMTIASGSALFAGGIANAGTLSLTNSTLSGNSASAGFGGGIFNFGKLSVTNSILRDNAAYAEGGGIYNVGTVTIINSTVSDNRAAGYRNASGGGLYNSMFSTLSVTNSTLSGNAADEGGGIYNEDFSTVNVTNCTLGGNSAADGGGIYNDSGTVTVANSALSGNSTSGNGGGIRNGSGTVTVTNSGISDNRAGHGGGISNESGTVTVTNSGISDNRAGYGGGISNEGTLSITGSTLSRNSASGGFGGGIINLGSLNVSNSTVGGNDADEGGGIFNGGGAVTLTNSSLSGNFALGKGGGAVVNVRGGTLMVNSSTLSRNSAFDGEGGGIASAGGLQSRNAIIAGNIAPTGPDLEGNLGSQGFNLIGNTQGASGFDPSDLLNVDPLVGPLQDNGGLTQTMALLPGSPALDAGDPDQLGLPDQRGVVRRGGVNIGAYQASASTFVLTAPDAVTAGVPFDVTVTAVDPFGRAAYGYTGTVAFSTSDPDPGVVLPADYTFTPDDQGTHTFSSGFTLVTPGDQTITATDAAGGFSASAVVTVQGGGARDYSRPTEEVSGHVLAQIRGQLCVAGWRNGPFFAVI